MEVEKLKQRSKEHAEEISQLEQDKEYLNHEIVEKNPEKFRTTTRKERPGERN